MKMWSKKSREEIKNAIQNALVENVNYQKESIIGLPASYLDEKVFNQDRFNLEEAPFLVTLISNPNHIGCHTLGSSESFFSGTQAIEKDLISICAEDILKGDAGQFDGYVSSGGTEANLQALWVYRNYFNNIENTSNSDIAILCSTDSHYSMDKGANLLSISIFKIEVDPETREVSTVEIRKTIQQAKLQGKNKFIVVVNMMTTMFGSVDNVQCYIDALLEEKCDFKIHIDAAFGGFYFPFSQDQDSMMNFKNPLISSITLDAHKMAQAPYGTGIFIIRKNLIHFTQTKEASYVEGEDCTLIGSRSGANAIAIWMILSTYGPHGWAEKILVLQKRTELICEQLEKRKVEFFRHPFSNIITLKKKYLSEEIIHKFGLIPDNHSNPEWYKIVIMDHVTMEKLNPFIEMLSDNLSKITI